MQILFPMSLTYKSTDELTSILKKRRTVFSTYRFGHNINEDAQEAEWEVEQSLNIQVVKDEDILLPLEPSASRVETDDSFEAITKTQSKSAAAGSGAYKSYSERMRSGVFRRRVR